MGLSASPSPMKNCRMLSAGVTSVAVTARAGAVIAGAFAVGAGGDANITRGSAASDAGAGTSPTRSAAATFDVDTACALCDGPAGTVEEVLSAVLSREPVGEGGGDTPIVVEVRRARWPRTGAWAGRCESAPGLTPGISVPDGTGAVTESPVSAPAAPGLAKARPAPIPMLSATALSQAYAWVLCCLDPRTIRAEFRCATDQYPIPADGSPSPPDSGGIPNSRIPRRS